MNRDNFYSEILPIADAMLQAPVDRDFVRQCWGNGYQNLCIIGPDADEIESLMPMTASTVTRGGGWWSEPALDDDGKIVSGWQNPAVFPIDEDTDLNALLEDFWYWLWCEDWIHPFVLLAPPPEARFAQQFQWPDFDQLYRDLVELRGPAGAFGLMTGDFDRNEATKAAWESFRHVINPNTSFALSMACALGRCQDTWIALPDEHLSHRASAKLRTWSANKMPKYVREMEEMFVEGAHNRLTIRASQEAATWEEVRLACWMNEPTPFVPDCAWAVEMDEAQGEAPRAITLAGNTRGRGVACLYYRRKLTGRSRDAAVETDFWQRLFAIASGDEGRTEDDRFVLSDDIYGPNAGDYWSVCGDDPTDQPMWASAKMRGYAPKTVAEVCQRVMHCRDLSEAQFSPGQILIPLRGHEAGCALKQWPTPPRRADSDESGDDAADSDRAEANPVSYVVPEAIILRCDDPDFLCRQLIDSFDYIISKSLGSLSQPIVPRHLVENLKLFWPPTHERNAISHAIDATIGLSHERAAPIEKAIDDLRRDVSRFLRSASQSGDWVDATSSPFWFARAWRGVQTSIDEITNELQLAAGVFWQNTVRKPPITIGNLMRRKRVADERAERIKLQFELGELLLRHHAFVGLALLREVDPVQLAVFLHEWFEGRTAWNGSMGHWKEAGSRIAALLRKRTGGDGSEYIRPLTDDYLSVDTGKYEAVAGPMIHLRNEQLGHGFWPTGLAAATLEETVDGYANTLSSLLDYLSGRMLLHVNGRWLEPTGTWLNVRYLTGDNEIVEAGKLQVEDSAAAAAYDGRVHVLTGRGWHMLPLEPWLIYRPDEKHAGETLWLFDGFDEKAVR